MNLVADDKFQSKKEFFLRGLKVAEEMGGQVLTNFFQNVRYHSLEDIKQSLLDTNNPDAYAINDMCAQILSSFDEIEPYQLPLYVEPSNDNIDVYIEYLLSQIIAELHWRQIIEMTAETTQAIVDAIRSSRGPT